MEKLQFINIGKEVNVDQTTFPWNAPHVLHRLMHKKTILN